MISDTGARFLHVVPDEKFIDGARQLFEEAAPTHHDYLILSQTNELRFIRTFAPLRLDLTSAASSRALSTLSNYDAVFVHYLNASARLLVDSAPASTSFIWIGWGGDYYHLICDRGELIMPETKALLANLTSNLMFAKSANAAKQFLKNAWRGICNPFWALRQLTLLRRLHHIGPNRPGEQALLTRFKLFAPVLAEDYEAIKDGTIDFQANFVSWNYPSIASDPQPITSLVDGCNILLGNSATPENNHVDTFDLIQEEVGMERKIICPLSYGISTYGDAVESMGYERFGERFRPLRQFMTPDAYTSTLNTCSVVAMNHIRQQALGNILLMLWLGSKVFINHRSPIMSAMEKLGIQVFDVRLLPEFLRYPERPTSDNEIADIRERLTGRYGHSTLIRMTNDLLTKCTRQPHYCPTTGGQRENGVKPS